MCTGGASFLCRKQEKNASWSVPFPAFHRCHSLWTWSIFSPCSPPPPPHPIFLLQPHTWHSWLCVHTLILEARISATHSPSIYRAALHRKDQQRQTCIERIWPRACVPGGWFWLPLNRTSAQLHWMETGKHPWNLKSSRNKQPRLTWVLGMGAADR